MKTKMNGATMKTKITNLYAVSVFTTWGYDNPVTLFENYDEAIDYLQWLWEDYYNDEIVAQSRMNESECWHEENEAKLTWADGNTLHITLTYVTKPDAKFYEKYRQYKKEEQP